MTTNRTQLNSGMPDIPSPPELTDDATRYGNALIGAFGKQGAPTGFGDFLRRTGSVSLALTVTTNTVTVGPGAVLAVQSTTGSVTGPMAIIVSGAPATGQVKVEPQSNGTQKLTFESGDAVTEAGVYLLTLPADLLTFLEATTVPA